MARIVLINANESQRLLYEWVLQEEGYEVFSFEALPDVVSLPGGRRADLVLIDAGVKESTVRERIRRTRVIFPGAAVVLLTGFRPLLDSGDECSADAVLLKSSDLRMFWKTIESLLADREERRAG